MDAHETNVNARARAHPSVTGSPSTARHTPFLGDQTPAGSRVASRVTGGDELSPAGGCSLPSGLLSDGISGGATHDVYGMTTVEEMPPENGHVKCRLCGVAIHDDDAIVVVSGDPLHVPCAEAAGSASSDWKHTSITTLSQMARGQGSAAAPH